MQAELSAGSLRYKFGVDAEEFRAVHSCAQVEVDYVQAGEFGVLFAGIVAVAVGDDAVQERFDSDEVGSGGRSLAGIVDSVAADGSSNAAGGDVCVWVVLLLGFRIVVGGVLSSVWWDLRMVDRRYRPRGDQASDLSTVEDSPVGCIWELECPAVGEGSAIDVEVQTGVRGSASDIR